MRTTLAIFTILFMSLGAYAQDKAEFKFETETIDYGKIKQGSNGVRVFEFTNIGKSPLVISRVQASCGCTVPKKPEGPILPGEKGTIEVSYDTKRLGGFSKMISIFSNAKTAMKKIQIKGFVEPASVPEAKKNMLSNDN